MSEKQTKLQEFATKSDREFIFEQLLAGKTIHEISASEMSKGEQSVLDTIKMALLPENYNNLPPFDIKTRTFSDEAFAKELSFLNHPLESDDFTDKELALLIEKKICKYWQLLSIKPPIKNENYFSFPIEMPIVFTEKQRAQLIK
jgi:hypothetical protein